MENYATIGRRKPFKWKKNLHILISYFLAILLKKYIQKRNFEKPMVDVNVYSDKISRKILLNWIHILSIPENVDAVWSHQKFVKRCKKKPTHTPWHVIYAL